MKDVLNQLVRAIVDHPDDVVIEDHMDGDATIFVIQAHPEDYGKIIGKNGRIIRALRDMMKILAAKHDMYVDIEIAEDSAPAEASQEKQTTEEETNPEAGE